MRISIDDGELRKSIESMKVTIPAAAEAAGRMDLKELAEKLAQRVRDMIPDDGGWFDIYRESIQYVEINPDHYEVEAQVTEMKFGSVEADSSLLWFSGGDEIARLLAAGAPVYGNPWTVDTLPSVAGGITSDLIVRPASESEVDHHRRRQRNNISYYKVMLNRIGKPLQENELAIINGRVLADVPFLVRRLEYGLGGFPRTPIWGRLEAEQGKVQNEREFGKEGYDQFGETFDKEE